MNNKISVNEANKLRSHIKNADASLSKIISIIEQQAIPVICELFRENIDQNQKLSKSLSALIATGDNQHLRFVKLINMLDERAKVNKILETLGKTSYKCDKLIAELRIVESRLEEYILITKTKHKMAGVHASCKYCAAALVEHIAEFEGNIKNIKDFFINDETKN